MEICILVVSLAEIFAKGQVSIQYMMHNVCACLCLMVVEGGARPIAPLCMIGCADRERRQGGECGVCNMPFSLAKKKPYRQSD